MSGGAEGPTARSRLAWGLVPVAVVLHAVSMVLNWGRPFVGGAPLNLGLLLSTSGMLLLVVVGALIANRRRHNPIGWLLIGGGLLGIVTLLAGGYGFRALATGAPLPAATAANWLGQWLVVPMWILVGLVTLLFPDGRLLSARWRWFARAFTASGVGYTAVAAVEAWPARTRPMADIEHVLPFTGDTLTADLWPAFAALLAMTLVALVVRYRQGGNEERAQIRWLGLAGVAALVATIVSSVGWVPSLVLVAVATFGSLAPPVAIGVAILRYRLYAIDRIISRTVTYGVVVTVLAGVYGAGVVGVGTALSAVTGVEDSDLVVAVSVLAVIAVSRPVRSRVQAVVDRRFNRTGFLARRVVETFPERLRDEIDVEAIRGEIAHAAAVAVRPATASVWLADRTRPDATHSMPADPARPSPDPARQP